MRPSLRRRLAIWLLPPLVLLVIVNAFLSYLSALEAVNRAYDRSLTASIRGIAEGTHSIDGEILVDIPTSAFGIFDDSLKERVYYAVIAPNGRTITGYPDLQPPRSAAETERIHIEDGRYRGERTRIGVMKKRMYDPALEGGDSVTVVFAETTESRLALARELFADSLRRQLLVVALGAVLLVLALATALRPLMDLRDAVRRRKADDLTPIADAEVPGEVRPLIDAINAHTERLSAMHAARRRFLADAAHQIRTPLAVLNTQAEFGLRQEDPGEMRSTFGAVLGTVRSTRRMADQMLALSRAENADALLGASERVDLAEIARETAAELAQLALRRHIELAYEGAGDAPVTGDPQMLHELVANLLHNAIQYSPMNSQVVLSTGLCDDRVVLAVSDEGPGIPPEEREKVFQRFYRILGHGSAEGSGLGLAIVRQIAEVHGASLRLGEGEGGRGLHVEVEFARAPG